MQNKILKLFIAALFLLLSSNPALAQETSDSSSQVVLGATVLTEYPLGFGAQGTVFFPKAHVGLRAKYLRLIGAYIDSMNSIAVDAGYYNSATGEIIYEVLNESNYYEIGFSVYQTPNHGWYGDIGYSTITGTGQTKGTTVLEAISDVSLPTGPNTYDLYGQLTSLTLRAGYKFSFKEFGSIDLSAAVLKPLTSVTTIDREVTGPIQQAILDAANKELDEYINDLMKSDVYIPLIQVGWLYTF